MNASRHAHGETFRAAAAQPANLGRRGDLIVVVQLVVPRN
jgi:hypothetical protein